MTKLLCASCGHSFPDGMLEPASFSDRVGRCLSRSSELVRETQGKTSEDSHRLVQLGQLLQQLCGMMEEEVQLLQGRPKDPRGAPGTRGGTAVAASAGGAVGAKRNGADVLTLTQTSRRDGGAYMNGTAGSTARPPTQMMTTMDRTIGGGVAPLKMFDGTVPSYQMKRMVSAFDLVSATLYNILEGLAVQCRAGVALLWLRQRQNASSDLVAPFVVGRELSSLAHSAPYSTPESSVPCIVCQTGVALNLLPQPHPANAMTKSAAAGLSMTELMEETNAAQLLVPVHDRYTERNGLTNAPQSAGPPGTTPSRASVAAAAAAPPSASPSSVMAVVHLIGSPQHPVPFHRYNEEAAAQTAALLSHILSSYYDAMMAEWANRFYVPTTLHATAKYAATIDMRPDAKVMDDLTMPPLLIYRATVSDPREQQSANVARDALKLLQQSALRKSTPLQPMANVRDLCQHAVNMEANWVSAVQQTARLEKEIGALAEDLLRRDVGALQRVHDGKSVGGNNNGGRRRSMTSSASLVPSLPAGQRRRSAQPPAKDKAPAAPGVATTSSAATATATAAADNLTSVMSMDIPVELTPAVQYSLDGAAASAAAGNPIPPLSGDVLKPEEMEMLEAVTLRRLKTLGGDTTIFGGSS